MLTAPPVHARTPRPRSVPTRSVDRRPAGPTGPGSPAFGPQAVLAMQRAAGNAAVTALVRAAGPVERAGGAPVQRQPAPGSGGPTVAPADAAADACSTRCGGIPPSCPTSFCCPFPTGTATIIRSQIQGPFLAAIASQVRASVVPVWAMWFNGGTGVQDFTGRFATDFRTDPTTASVSRGLAEALPGQLDPVRLHALAAATPSGSTVSLRSALPPTHFATTSAALETDGDPLLMDFDTIGTAPGNLAGGVGKTQTSCSVGATPSPQDDARRLTDVPAVLVTNPDGSVTVTPSFAFRVHDTVDLCPGNCGSSLGVINEQLATVPMSRLEASGVSGDVPFFVDFGGPAQAPFRVPPPAPPVPQNVVLSASTLFDFGSDRLRPGAEAALLAQLGDRPAHADLSQPFAVEGHTDSKGSTSFNQGLSDRRAAVVAAVLERHFPNLAGRLSPVGFGESRPLVPNEHPDGSDDPAGRARNRRVELRFSAPPP